VVVRGGGCDGEPGYGAGSWPGCEVAGGPLDDFYVGVVALGPGVGEPQPQERLDRWCPSLDGGGQAGQLADVDLRGVKLERLETFADLRGPSASFDGAQQVA